jgi:hypothetical protein
VLKSKIIKRDVKIKIYKNRNIWKVLKCGAGEGWKRSVGLVKSEMKKYYLKSRSRGIFYIYQLYINISIIYQYINT